MRQNIQEFEREHRANGAKEITEWEQRETEMENEISTSNSREIKENIIQVNQIEQIDNNKRNKYNRDVEHERTE